MAGIDWREARCEEGDKGRLRPFEAECHLVVAVDHDLFEVAVPRLARIEPQFVGRFTLHQVQGAFDVLGGERLAVMPFDALAQAEGQPRFVLVPRPFASEVGDDRIDAGLRDMLVIHDQIVEDSHHRPLSGDGGFLMDRHAGGAVEKIHLQHAARFLRDRRAGDDQRPDRDKQAHNPLHLPGSFPVICRARRLPSGCRCRCC